MEWFFHTQHRQKNWAIKKMLYQVVRVVLSHTPAWAHAFSGSYPRLFSVTSILSKHNGRITQQGIVFKCSNLNETLRTLAWNTCFLLYIGHRIMQNAMGTHVSTTWVCHEQCDKLVSKPQWAQAFQGSRCAAASEIQYVWIQNTMAHQSRSK